MKIRFYFTKLIPVFLSLIFIIGLSSCGGLFTSGIRPLSGDFIDREEGFNSILFWRFRIIDHTSECQGWPSMIFDSDIARSDVEQDMDAEWFLKGNLNCYDVLLVRQAKASDFRLRRFSIPVFNGSFVLNADDAWKLNPGTLTYLGSFTVEVLAKTFVEGKGISYNCNIYHNSDIVDFSKDLKDFKMMYPMLYENYKDNAEIAEKYLLYEDFYWFKKQSWPIRREDPYFDAEYNIDEYMITSKHDGSSNVFIYLPKDMPANYDIELKSSWKEGINDFGYGLILGTNLENAYHFVISGNAQSAVALFRNNNIVKPYELAWKESLAIYYGDGEITNTQRIQVRGDSFGYYVNDELIGNVKKDKNINLNIIGLTVSGKQIATFKTLKIMSK
jgi:hypothetical protein